MPQLSKGARDHVTVRAPSELALKKKAQAAGYAATSQYIADILAIIHGHPELVEGPKRLSSETLPGMPTETELLALLSTRRADQSQEVNSAA